ncbi:hypothetical protein N7492_004888 [Penicillium capsulatum]|uniref:SHSP domain-containing protein n=1 Tax=Penicillium capsulatum TaxID=69766 RepID=A0A9W9IBA4_9EURO|nr:hypothetical protein N7492_004888 [Penicillium capsulatum]KAJ6136004.1 hypothetical protein N7512_001164 [Penicillium capsulatum]
MPFLSCHSDLAPLLRLLDPPHPRSTRTRFTPAFDVRELTDGYYLDGELPGVDQSQIDIEFTDPHTLVIQGRTDRNYHQSPEKPETSKAHHQPTVEDETDESDDNSRASKDSSSTSAPTPPESFHFWASERSVGQFQRTFTFTTRVDQDHVRANFKNGILSLVVPKATTPQTKKIRIQ